MSVILAVDPGEVRIGIAISDPTATIARPLKVLRHEARAKDASLIVCTAEEYEAATILVGVALDEEGEEGHQARKSLRLVEAIRLITDIKVVTSDESFTTASARRKSCHGKKDPDLDARAAAYLLQEYLDAKKT